MLRVGRDEQVSIGFDECEAMLAWRDGRRVLFGSDAVVLDVVPARWINGDRVVEQLDRSVPIHARVPMPDADPALAPEVPDFGEPWLGWAICFGLLVLAIPIGAVVGVSTAAPLGIAAAIAVTTFAIGRLRTKRTTRGLRGRPRTPNRRRR